MEKSGSPHESPSYPHEKQPTPPKSFWNEQAGVAQDAKQFDFRKPPAPTNTSKQRQLPSQSNTAKPTANVKKVLFFFGIQCEVFEFMLDTVQEGERQAQLNRHIPKYDKPVLATNCVILCLLYNEASMLSNYLASASKGCMPELPHSISVEDYQAFLMNDSEVNKYVGKLQKFEKASQEHLKDLQRRLDRNTTQGKELSNISDNVMKHLYWNKDKTRVLMDVADKYFLWVIDFYNSMRIKLRQNDFEVFMKVTTFMGKSYFCLMRDVYFDFDTAWQKQSYVKAADLRRYLEAPGSIERIVVESISAYLDKHVTLQTTISRVNRSRAE